MSPSPCLKARISSPLEAGSGLAFSDQLPGHVEEALHYVSKRLGRKSRHLTLLVVRRDYQLPTSPVASPTFTPSPRVIPAASLPLRINTPAPSRLQTLKQLVRPSHSGEGQVKERIVHAHLDHRRNGTVSPAFSEASVFSASTVSSRSTATDSPSIHRTRWPGSPTANGSVPVTPATPFTPFSAMSSVSGTTGLSSLVSRFGPALTPARFGTKLIYSHPLDPREEKSLRQAFDKAAKKYHLDPSFWFPEPVLASALGLPVDLVLKSVAQNEALFTSDRLTLLSLDHLYTFRTALQAYARSKVVSRLEDAVDELRRLFLASGRRALRKSALLAAYRWLDPVSDDALADVCPWPLSGGGGVDSSVAVTKQPPGAAQRQVVVVPPPVETPPRPQPEPRAETPVHANHLISVLDKEMMLLPDVDDVVLDDDSSDLDAIEAWYREIERQQKELEQDQKLQQQQQEQQQQSQPQQQEQSQQDVFPTVEMHPLRSNPATTNPSSTAAAIIPPRPETPAPPPPTTATYRDRPWEKKHLVEPDLDEMRRTTPKLRPAPPRRGLGQQ
ncbi:hypothetical protein VTJ49DRAFT_4383 [Mycothermus thermophilus]|uniref:DUF7582 domain-containing protein n=1 Tax=Humicola insolens TaxID=85995 RepID=A0ABR3VLH3_HUMIN